jgi:hypothetical protein
MGKEGRAECGKEGARGSPDTRRCAGSGPCRSGRRNTGAPVRRWKQAHAAMVVRNEKPGTLWVLQKTDSQESRGRRGRVITIT